VLENNQLAGRKQSGRRESNPHDQLGRLAGALWPTIPVGGRDQEIRYLDSAVLPFWIETGTENCRCLESVESWCSAAAFCAPCSTEPSGGVIAFQQQQLHNDAMSTSITVRDVPDQTRDELASRAALSGRSLQEYLRAKLIELARQPDAEVLIARVRARKAASASTLPRDRILEYRDEDRR